MANEKRLIPFGEKVTLDDLPFGAMFAFGDDCIAIKSEYRCDNGLIEAFIIDSGEQFWGGAKTAKEQNALMVQPLEIVDAPTVDAVEVVRCKDCDYYEKEYRGFGFCKYFDIGRADNDFCSRCIRRCEVDNG